MLVRPMLLHHMSLVSFLLFRKNLGNLQEFFGQMVYRPPWPKIARTPMPKRPPKVLSDLLEIFPSAIFAHSLAFSWKFLQ